MPKARRIVDHPLLLSQVPGSSSWDPPPAPLDTEGKWRYLGCFSLLPPFSNPASTLLGKECVHKMIFPLWLCCHPFSLWHQDSHHWLHRRSLPSYSAHFPLSSLFIDSSVLSCLPVSRYLTLLFFTDPLPYFTLSSLSWVGVPWTDGSRETWGTLERGVANMPRELPSFF